MPDKKVIAQIILETRSSVYRALPKEEGEKPRMIFRVRIYANLARSTEGSQRTYRRRRRWWFAAHTPEYICVPAVARCCFCANQPTLGVPGTQYKLHSLGHPFLFIYSIRTFASLNWTYCQPFIIHIHKHLSQINLLLNHKSIELQ